MHTLFARIPIAAGALVFLAGCASDGQAQPEATARSKDERCVVTGSNVPKRDCRHDVEKLPPGAVESLMPVLQSKKNGGG